MTRSGLFTKYRDLSPEEQCKFEGWLKANAVLASLFALALVAMAIYGAGQPGPDTATGKSPALASVLKP